MFCHFSESFTIEVIIELGDLDKKFSLLHRKDFLPVQWNGNCTCESILHCCVNNQVNNNLKTNVYNQLIYTQE